MKPDNQHDNGIRGQHYSRKFYAAQEPDSIRSAQAIVPILAELTRPKSVVDVGCGTGIWLSVFRKLGVRDIFGVDGEWVDPRSLRIPPEKFQTADLSEPLRLGRRFDLAISLEVAEHLPASAATTFVDSLVNLSSVVLFSAAIPYQGGTQHINEQWPDYWVRMFEPRGYHVIDCIRHRVWNNPEVQWWYAQNMFVFTTDRYLQESPTLLNERKTTHLSQLALVHPRKYLAVTDPTNLSMRTLIRTAALKYRNHIRRRPNVKEGTG